MEVMERGQIISDLKKLDEGKRVLRVKTSEISDFDVDSFQCKVRGEDLHFSDYALGQYLKKMKIPKYYFMNCSLDLREKEVREGQENISDKSATVLRIKDGVIYGMVPPQYNLQQTGAFMEKLFEHLPDDYAVKVTTNSLEQLEFITILNDKAYNAEVDSVNPMGVVSFSEVGKKPFTVAAGLYRLVCTNGMRLPEGKEITYKMSMSRYNEDAVIQTMEAMGDVVFTNLEDVAKVFEYTKKGVLPESKVVTELDPLIDERLEKIFSRNRAALEDFGLKIKTVYVENGDFTLKGLLNAITQTGRDCKELANKKLLEEAAGKVVYSLYSQMSKHSLEIKEENVTPALLNTLWK